jgi:hypothetical protein
LIYHDNLSVLSHWSFSVQELRHFSGFDILQNGVNAFATIVRWRAWRM